MSARWWTFVMWALAAASALFWGLKLFVTAPPLPPRTPVAAPGAVARGDLTRLLGADAQPLALANAPEPAADARYQLLGVVSPRAAAAAREGLALIAVDGKPAKAFRVGAIVDGQTVLQAVSARGVKLGPRAGAVLVALNIAPPPPAATGALPAAAGANAAQLPQFPPPFPPPGLPPQMQSSQVLATPAGPQFAPRRILPPPMPQLPAGTPGQDEMLTK